MTMPLIPPLPIVSSVPSQAPNLTSEAPIPDEAAFLAALESALGAITLAGRAGTPGVGGEVRAAEISSNEPPLTPATFVELVPSALGTERDGSEVRPLEFEPLNLESALAAVAPGFVAGGTNPLETSDESRPALPHTEQLNPEFRSRLERVIQRMESEFGYKVEIVELVRSQARQDALFESGRSTSGPVVTWTRNSKHTTGRAADVMIDGSYMNRVAFEKLAVIAKSEGLRTLGPRDAGHIELPESRFDANGIVQRSGAQVASLTSGSRSGTIAHVATVAPVARVAQVATVATPFVTPLQSQVDPKPVTTNVTAAPPSNTDFAITPASTSLGNASSEHRGHESSSDRRENDSVPAMQRLESLQLVRQIAGSPDEASAKALQSTGTGSIDRVAHILDLKEAAAERPVSSVLLRLEHPSGGEDRVRLDARGRAISATIEVSDTRLAEDLGRRVAELAGSMQRQGLEPELLSIRSAAARDVVMQPSALHEQEARRVAATLTNGGSSATGRESRGTPGRQDNPHSETSRERPRRNSQGDR